MQAAIPYYLIWKWIEWKHACIISVWGYTEILPHNLACYQTQIKRKIQQLKKSPCELIGGKFVNTRVLLRLQNGRFFFSKSLKKSVKRGVRVLRAWSARASHARRACEAREKSVSPQSRSLFSALFQTFCLTARAYLNTQKYGLFCSLSTSRLVHAKSSAWLFTSARHT